MTRCSLRGQLTPLVPTRLLLTIPSRYSRIYKGMQQLVKEVRARHQPFQNLLSPARHLVYMPSFSWQYLGRNMRPLMEALCWILAAMAAGLHDASPALHPDKGWGGWVGIQGEDARSWRQAMTGTHMRLVCFFLCNWTDAGLYRRVGQADSLCGGNLSQVKRFLRPVKPDRGRRALSTRGPSQPRRCDKRGRNCCTYAQEKVSRESNTTRCDYGEEHQPLAAQADADHFGGLRSFEIPTRGILPRRARHGEVSPGRTGGF